MCIHVYMYTCIHRQQLTRKLGGINEQLAEEREDDNTIIGILEPGLILGQYFNTRWPQPIPGANKEGKMLKVGDLTKNEQ